MSDAISGEEASAYSVSSTEPCPETLRSPFLAVAAFLLLRERHIVHD